MIEEVGAKAPKAPNDESPEAATPRPSRNGSSTGTVDQAGASVNPNLDAALSYLQHGYSIFPLVPRTKRPAVKIEDYLHGRKRMDQHEARSYWTVHPEDGVAI